jgi:hypothetical protein
MPIPATRGFVDRLSPTDALGLKPTQVALVACFLDLVFSNLVRERSLASIGQPGYLYPPLLPPEVQLFPVRADEVWPL